MKKVILTAALFAAMNINLSAQKVVELTKWEYSRDSFVEKFTNPDFNTWLIIDWLRNEIRTPTDTFPLKFWTNDRLLTQNFEYGGQVFVEYMNRKGEYIGHLVKEN